MQLLPLLSVGKDTLLLATRNQVLKVAGYDVISAASVSEALHSIPSQDLCAVVLCHSLTPSEREQIRAALKVFHPNVPVVVVCCGARDPYVDEIVVESDPRALVRTIAKYSHPAAH